MQEKHLYEYSVIRILPRVEREEFLNVGIILFSKRQKFLKMLYKLDEKKLNFFSEDLDFEQLQLNFKAFEKITNGDKNAGPIAHFDIPSRFRWLTAQRSSVIQTSRPHPGLCYDLDKTLNRLFQELVM